MNDLDERRDLSDPRSGSASSHRSACSVAVSMGFHAAMATAMWFIVYPAMRRESISLTAAAGGEIGETVFVTAMKKADEPAIDPAPIDVGAPVHRLLSDAVRFDRLLETSQLQIEPAAIDFFGIHAYGNQFVFALDISYSMDARGGERFRRACDELVRSVSMLRRGQRYYVYLFCWNTEEMYYNPVVEYVDVHAGHAEKLRHWITRVSLGSGTDPRRALARAAQMQPDAVFLLSDGRFNQPRSPTSESGWLGVDGSRLNIDVQSGVELFFRDIPIHTIAFENPYTRAAMKRIAEATGGTSRYIKTKSLAPVDSQRFLTVLRHIDRKHVHDKNPRKEYRTRLSLARELIAEGELVYAEFLVRPLRNSRASSIDHPALWDEVFSVLDRELGEMRLEDFQRPPDLSDLLGIQP